MHPITPAGGITSTWWWQTSLVVAQIVAIVAAVFLGARLAFRQNDRQSRADSQLRAFRAACSVAHRFVEIILDLSSLFSAEEADIPPTRGAPNSRPGLQRRLWAIDQELAGLFGESVPYFDDEGFVDAVIECRAICEALISFAERLVKDPQWPTGSSRSDAQEDFDVIRVYVHAVEVAVRERSLGRPAGLPVTAEVTTAYSDLFEIWWN
jgi:hypothetical protein